MGGSFDQWQKDVFFSAAEAVQESADIMESLYRTWIRNRRERFDLEASDELRRELQTALGTAKWQLEEFEKAVKVTQKSHSSEDNIVARHREFVAAIGNQILHVEKELNGSLIKEGKQPMRWVQLDDEERDDLALFLSGAQQEGRQAKLKDVDHSKPEFIRSFKDTVTINKDKRYVVEVAEKEPHRSKDDEVERSHGQSREQSSLDIGAWKILVADDCEDNNRSGEARPGMLNGRSGIQRTIESRSELNFLRNNLWKAKNEDHHQLRHGLSYYLDLNRIARFTQGINRLIERSRNCFSNRCQWSKPCHSLHLAGRVCRSQRHIAGSQHHMHFSPSLRIAFLLMLSFILVVPFVICST